MSYVSTTNVQGFIYYFGIFYLKIGKFYTLFQLGKGPIMGPKISPGKSLCYIKIGYEGVYFSRACLSDDIVEMRQI